MRGQVNKFFYYTTRQYIYTFIHLYIANGGRVVYNWKSIYV